MSCPYDMHQEVGQLRAQLDEARLALARAEGERTAYERALAIIAAARVGPVAEPLSLPAPRHAPSVTVTRDSHAVTRDSVTPSVTGEGEDERRRRLARERKRSQRARQPSVTVPRDSVTPSVTQKEEKKIRRDVVPPSPPAAPARGALALVTTAARDSQRDTPREHRAAATLPAEVGALRTAWNELAAPHGFAPWGERTSGALLRDALAALERRPLEEWRRVFALVPRSPLCRGELRRRQHTNLAYLLSGQTAGGYEPAEQLLSGAWTVDPLPEAPAPAPPAPAEAPLPEPEDTPAARAWHAVLQTLRTDGRTYAADWLGQLRGREVREGHLVLECPDRFVRAWVEEHYGELLRHYTALLGHESVLLELPEGGAP